MKQSQCVDVLYFLNVFQVKTKVSQSLCAFKETLYNNFVKTD